VGRRVYNTSFYWIKSQVLFYWMKHCCIGYTIVELQGGTRLSLNDKGHESCFTLVFFVFLSHGIAANAMNMIGHDHIAAVLIE
jgi:hypothetical protein